MSGFDYPVIVIGAGPAGARVAELLAQGGARVLVLEAGRLEREKLCGGLLHPLAQPHLPGPVPEDVRLLPGTPTLEYRDLDHRLRLELQPGYSVIHRGKFDDWLRARACAAGAELLAAQRVVALHQTAEGVRVETERGSYRATCVIDASGWQALSRRQSTGHGWSNTGAPVLALQGLIEADLPPEAMWAIYHSATTPFYGWLVPQGGQRFLLGAGFASGRRPALPPGPVPGWSRLAVYLEFLDRCGAHSRILDTHLRGCPITIIRGLNDLWWGGGMVFSIGEAAGLVSPASGGGIHYALAHAEALAAALLAAGCAKWRGAGLLPLSLRQELRLRVRVALGPELARLRISCLKARVVATAATRIVGAGVLLALGRHRVQRVPWALDH